MPNTLIHESHLLATEKFTNVRTLLDALMKLGQDDMPIDVWSPDDRSTGPFVMHLELWDEKFSDGKHVLSLRIVEHEAE